MCTKTHSQVNRKLCSLKCLAAYVPYHVFRYTYIGLQLLGRFCNEKSNGMQRMVQSGSNNNKLSVF